MLILKSWMYLNTSWMYGDKRTPLVEVSVVLTRNRKEIIQQENPVGESFKVGKRP